MAETPAPICIMARVMMNEGMPIFVTPIAVISPRPPQAARASRMATGPGTGRLAMFTLDPGA